MSDEPWKFFAYIVCVWRLEGTITIKKISQDFNYDYYEIGPWGPFY